MQWSIASSHFALDPPPTNHIEHQLTIIVLLSLFQNIDRNRKIKAMNGTQCYLMDVIAHILHELKLKLLTGMRDFGYKDMKASDFDWVITVPAIWKSKGKRMMREAGYKVTQTQYCMYNRNDLSMIFGDQQHQAIVSSVCKFKWHENSCAVYCLKLWQVLYCYS